MDKNNLYGYTMLRSFQTGWFKWLDPAKINFDRYDDSNLRVFVLKIDFEYPKDLREFHNGYPLAPDKLEIKKEMLFDYQLKTSSTKKNMCFITKSWNFMKD